MKEIIRLAFLNGFYFGINNARGVVTEERLQRIAEEQAEKLSNIAIKKDIDEELARETRQEQEREREYDDECDDEEDMHPAMYGDQER
ncbi:MAG: hypothetical protein BWY21_01999 [Parcubacteria group bacterium ADurb.Bin216]|nr:MAG: hypothetical protein BWY21_01999 [Parcubacteria group bacterium ADurb.Bin216]